ncbi:E3 ubiquitin-protein ligase WAV3-like, partial [Carex rostrata]
MMIFNDDEPVPATTRPTVPERIWLTIQNNYWVPPEENIQKVMLELKGRQESRLALDLVVVLDVSNSMEGGKLEELQRAMQFVIKKLSVVDRLSIVRYKSHAEMLCPLRQMTESTQTELQNLINDLFPKGSYMNITDGLLMALKILNDRSVNSGRVGAIMLISGGEENIGNAAAVPVGNVPVHTFGFGNHHDPKVLKAIANNSLGGTYSDVWVDNLTLAFSQCLGGLLSVVAQDLTVTVRQIKDNSTIRQVSSGSYPQSVDNTAGSVTITFGDIYIDETRTVLVDLHLPSTRKQQRADVLEVSYTYKFNGELFEAEPETVTVRRMSRLIAEEQQALPWVVRAEEV